jgi:ATP-dependent Clp protease ATP-binding subunit ClpA
MFERFTADARQAVHLALSEARVLRASRIGTEHLLLGLAHGRSGAAADALRAEGLDPPTLRKLTMTQPGSAPLDADSLAVLGIDLDEVRRAAEAAFGPGALDQPARPAGSRTTRARMTTEAKEAISLGLRIARARHDYAVTAGHLLAGLIDQGDNEAVRLLRAADVDPVAVRADVVNRLSRAA